MDDSTIAVTIEYPQVRQRQRIHELSAVVGFPVRPLLTVPYPRGLEARSYAADLTDGLGDTDAPIGLVVAFCLAASIGQEVVRIVAGRQPTAPTLVLLDGSRTRIDHIRDAYREAAAHYGGDDRNTLPSLTAEALRCDPARVVADIEDQLYDLAVRRLATSHGQAERARRTAQAVVDVSIDWIRHLVASFLAGTGHPATVVVFADSDEADHGSAWPGVVHSRRIHVGGRRATLAGNPAVADLLSREMTRWRAHAST